MKRPVVSAPILMLQFFLVYVHIVNPVDVAFPQFLVVHMGAALVMLETQGFKKIFRESFQHTVYSADFYIQMITL